MGDVIAHGVSAHSHLGSDVSARLQKAMERAILDCNAQGIANTEENAERIKRCMRRAHQTELMAITREQHYAAMDSAELEHQHQLIEVERVHRERVSTMTTGFYEDMQALQATIDELGGE